MAKQALNLMGAMVTAQSVGRAFGATMISHPELPSDKLFFVDSKGEVVAVIVNIGVQQDCGIADRGSHARNM
jgi:hypothetical protein